MKKEHNPLARAQRDMLIAGGASISVGIVIACASAAMGNIGDAEARRLLEAIVPTSRLFCSSLLTVSATILALMLAMIGLGKQSDTKLSEAHYHRIVKIAFYDALLFSLTTIAFVLHCVPIYESDALPSWWYSTIYYGVLVTTSALAGGSVGIVVLLYLAVKDVVQVVGLEMDDHYYAADPSKDELASTGESRQPNRDGK